MSNTTNNVNSNTTAIALTPFGTFVKSYVKGDTATTLSIAGMTAAGIDKERAQNYIDFGVDFFCAIGAMMDMREGTGHKPTIEFMEKLAAAESIVKQKADTWFKDIGTRPAKSGSTDKKLRPCYGVRYSDFALFGEMVAQAMQLANNDPVKAPAKFFEVLVIGTGRILNGAKLGRISVSEFNKAKKTMNEVRAEKAANTKASNAKGNTATEAANAEAQQKLVIAETTLAAKMTEIGAAITLIMNSHATADEKAAIVALLNPIAIEPVVKSDVAA